VDLSTFETDDLQVLAISEKGYGKRTPLSEFRQQNRGGKGVILIDASERNGPVVGLALVKEDDEVMLMTNRGQTIRTRVAEIRETGRNAQGVKVMKVEADERVVAIEPVGEREEEPEEGAEAGAEATADEANEEPAIGAEAAGDDDEEAGADDESEDGEEGEEGGDDEE
jgi:DNA gyrase subunit A